uniref:sensor histidine kinase n=1 Tax=Olsenella timonensis TaxID=1805478 RepID=UPI00094EA0A0|nr:HAMP domain-containing sensor histidine kinase [Olsenella timonensis]
MPLSFVIARYFAYAFAAVALAWVVAFLLLSSAINMGWVYEASWGPANAAEVGARLSEEGDLGREDVPTAYRYVVVGADGTIAETDLEGTRLEAAIEAACAALSADPGDVTIEGGGGGLTYASFALSQGGACALVSEYLPQWVSHDLARALPNPQNLMLAVGALGSAAGLALVARRASRVIARKMAPLVEAAERVGQERLDFSVGRTNVREVNDVLAAMDAMRSSLAASLEARWEAERAQREQIASLAHDLKTPLTVLRANADFVSEELAGTEERGGGAGELVAAARDIADGTERLDAYVRLLIEASNGANGGAGERVSPGELCRQVVAEAGPVVRARGLELVASVDPAVGDAERPELDRVTLTRAAANLVSNAAEHARSRVEVSCSAADGSLVVEVADDGPGFSPAALEHGCERLFTDDASRSARDGSRHYGLGLFTTAEAARAHGGSVTLANRPGDGAVVTLRIPLTSRPGPRPSAGTPRQGPSAAS